MSRSDNIQPPFLGPQFPIYPELPQVVRVVASAGIVYAGFIQQFTPPLGLADQEACFVWEPNGITLLPGYYDCRLVGSYEELPLLVTTCCGGGGSSSSK